jgi:uncharacterized delta-60 repeat protein
MNHRQRSRGTARKVAAKVLGIGMIFSAMASQAGNADPDPSFSGGVLLREVGPTNDLGFAAAVMPNGTVVVGGSTEVLSSTTDSALIRHGTNGVPDASFGDGYGKVITAMSPSFDSVADLAVVGNAGVVTAGYAYQGNYPAIALAKYNSAGVLDTTFGGGTGKVITPVGAYGAIARAVAVQSNGKIVVAGESTDPALVTKTDFIVARYNVDGSLDSTFGAGGIQRIDVAGFQHDSALGVAVQTDGKIVLVGETRVGAQQAIGIVRLTAGGLLDASFGSGGKATFSPSGLITHGRAVAIQPDGKIVVLGNAIISSTNTTMIVLLRFTAGGVLDTTFNAGVGYALNGFGAGLALSFSGLELLPTGQILVSGRGAISTQNRSLFLTARYTSAGLIDTTYNNGVGHKLGDLSSDGMISTSAETISVTPNGRFIVSGYSGGYFGMVKYMGDPVDVTPAGVTLTPVNAAAPSTTQISNTVVVSGLTSGAMVPISCSYGKYSINGGPFVSTFGYVKNGDQIRVSLVSAATSGGVTSAVLRFGGVHAANNRLVVIGNRTVATFKSTTL